MLSFAAFCPHPPIIIPEIGKSETTHTEKTILAMQTLGERFAEKKPEKVIIVSPHTLLLHNRIALSHASELSGSMSSFNAGEISFSFNCDKEIGQKIALKAAEKFINIELLQEENEIYPLSHGEIVPLYFLAKAYDNFDLIVSGFSDFSLEKHFEYGQCIGEIIREEKNKIAFIASGDLSHRLKMGAPAGYSAFGEEFDTELIQLLQKKDIKGVLNLDKHIISEAAECGLRSLIILLGVLDGMFYKVDCLSYEGPFGVGYAAIDFRI